MDKLLIVCGPTASGKTALAVSLAKKFNGELVSADSRQMYKGLNVLTGKDLPARAVSTSHFKPTYHSVSLDLVTYELSGIPIWLYDVAPSETPLSISLYKYAASAAIEDIRKRGKLPILVGGSGLYIRSICEDIETIDVPKNEKLREELVSLSVTDLQKQLGIVDAERLALMNNSDKQNSRRLIRAIEIGMSKKHTDHKRIPQKIQNVLWIGIRHTKENLGRAITARVEARWMGGAISEVQGLEKLDSHSLLASSLGIGPILDYLKGIVSEGEAKKMWTTQEVAYAKRQMVWFRKNSLITWYDPTISDLPHVVEMRVASWYTQR